MISRPALVRIVSSTLLLCLVMSGLGASRAHASEGAAVCATSLVDLESQRVSLDELQAAVADAQGRKDAAVDRALVLADLIAEAIGQRRNVNRLVQERAALLAQIEDINRVLPAIALQAKTLAAQVHDAELAYIECVEASL